MPEFITPTVEQLRDQFEYLAWGDRRCIEVARSVPEAGRFADQGMSFGSVHKMLVHMMVAQITWLKRFHGEPVSRMEDATDHPTLAAVETRWPAVHADLLAFASAQTSATLAGTFSFRSTAGQAFSLPLGHAMLHVSDHGTYHRGQLNSMAKRAGGTPLPIMRVTYVAERQAGG